MKKIFTLFFFAFVALSAVAQTGRTDTLFRNTDQEIVMTLEQGSDIISFSSNVTYTVLNMLGQETSINGTGIEVSLKDLPGKLKYFLVITNQSGATIVKQFVKQ